jgi:NAD(P)-dependent dehydrogenase (short-subunit alcohol dehydrogenase family)
MHGTIAEGTLDTGSRIRATGMFRLDGKVALVSGAGWGMGFGIEHAQARRGATAAINALSLGTMNNREGAEALEGKTTRVGRAGSPDDVGAAVAYLSPPEAAWVDGRLLPANGGSPVA